MMATKQVKTEPLRSYWSAMGHNLVTNYPDFPEAFTVHTCARCGLGTFDPPVIGGPDLYSTLGRQAFYYPTARWDHRTAAAFFARTPVDSIFEFGCGSGQFLTYARHLATQVVGLDSNTDAVKAACARGLTVHASWDEVGNMPFGAIVAFQSLEHIPDPSAVIARMVDRLAPGGYLVIAVPNEDGPLGTLVFNPLNAPPHHATLWPRTALEHVATAHSLELLSYEKEPINRDLYDILIGESLQAALPGTSIIKRSLRKVLGWKTRAAAALKFATDPDRLPDGHNHIAIYRKPTG